MNSIWWKSAIPPNRPEEVGSSSAGRAEERRRNKEHKEGSCNNAIEKSRSTPSLASLSSHLIQQTACNQTRHKRGRRRWRRRKRLLGTSFLCQSQTPQPPTWPPSQRTITRLIGPLSDALDRPTYLGILSSTISRPWWAYNDHLYVYARAIKKDSYSTVLEPQKKQLLERTKQAWLAWLLRSALLNYPPVKWHC